MAALEHMAARESRKRRTPSDARDDAQHVRNAAAATARNVQERKRANKAARAETKKNDNFANMFGRVDINERAAATAQENDNFAKMFGRVVLMNAPRLCLFKRKGEP